MNDSLDRRRFLGKALGTGAWLLILPSARTALTYQANERIELAILGHMYNAGHFFTSIHAYQNVRIAAVCNPDERKHAEIHQIWRDEAEKLAMSCRKEDQRAAETYRGLAENKPPAFSDFRRMFDQLGKGIDALVVSLFDHYHGPACGRAMREKKHVFSERPLGLTIADARALRSLAARQKVATSIRNPGNASPQFRRGVELVREGAIGDVEEVHIWFDRAGADLSEKPRGSPPVPAGLNWDAWLGPAADRPYHPDWMAYAQWREFSNGGIGTFGPHAANLAFLSLGVHELWQPGEGDAGTAERTIRVEADCPRRNRLSFPRWEEIRWRIPARGKLPPVRFTWHHGAGLSPGARQMLMGLMEKHGAAKEEQEGLLGYAGAILVGKKGLLATDDHNVKFSLLPEAEFKDIEQDRPKTVRPSRGHYHDWFWACRGGEPPLASFDYAGPLSELLMLGNVATQFEGELAYEPLAGRIVNHAGADAALSCEYRPGWDL